MLIGMTGGVLNILPVWGASIDRILKDNYKSVIAAQNMKETLERQDSAATFFLAGQTEKARTQYEANAPLFRDAYQTEAHNITEPGEQEIADDIGRRFEDYHKKVEALLYANPPMQSEPARNYYFAVLEPDFKKLKQRAQDVLNLNQDAILRANEQAKSEAWRASRAGEAATVGAFGLAILFAVWTTRAALTPLRTLARQAEEIGIGHLNQRILLNRTDEIGGLAASFNEMTEKLREARKLEAERLSRAERMSDAALESLYDPVVVTDAIGKGARHSLEPGGGSGFSGRRKKRKGLPTMRAVVSEETRLVDAVENAPFAQEQGFRGGRTKAGFLFRAKLADARWNGRIAFAQRPMRDEENDAARSAVAVLEDITHLRELDRHENGIHQRGVA